VVIPVVSEGDGHARETAIGQAVRSANAKLSSHQRIKGFTLWQRGDFPRTHLLKVKRHEVVAALTGAMPRDVATGRPAAEADRLTRLTRVLTGVAGTEASAIEPDTELQHDLNIDSLTRVELALRLEEEFAMPVADGDLATVATVEQLLDLLDRIEPDQTSATIPSWPRRLPARVARGVLQQALMFPLHRTICRPFDVQGRENLVGLSSPVLLIANHCSHLDTPSILRALPGPIRHHVAVAAATDYFYRSRPIGFCVSLACNAFPFRREGDVYASIRHCRELAAAGWSILIYPEGTRSQSGRLSPFKNGIGLLAKELRVPVIPLALDGPYEILPKGRAWPWPGPVTVSIGAPISPPPSGSCAGMAALLERAVASLHMAGGVTAHADQ
jgi:long-chain acyl-CoA synthetase